LNLDERDFVFLRGVCSGRGPCNQQLDTILVVVVLAFPYKT